jgi:hypothetical protein
VSRRKAFIGKGREGKGREREGGVCRCLGDVCCTILLWMDGIWKDWSTVFFFFSSFLDSYLLIKIWRLVYMASPSILRSPTLGESRGSPWMSR